MHIYRAVVTGIGVAPDLIHQAVQSIKAGFADLYPVLPDGSQGRRGIGAEGEIVNYSLRMRDQKRAAVEAFKNLNFKVISAGDSYNDLSMLRAADRAVLYRPTEKFAAENSDLPVARNYEELKKALERFMYE